MSLSNDTSEPTSAAPRNALICADGLPPSVMESMKEALQRVGYDSVRQMDDMRSAIHFDCDAEGCPRTVDEALNEMELIVLDEKVAGVSGFEVLGVLRGLEQTKASKILMLGPHGPHDHYSVLAAWGFGVDCYLTREDFIQQVDGVMDKFQRMAALLTKS